MMFLAGLFLSIGMALAQTQATGTVTAAEDGAPNHWCIYQGGWYKNGYCYRHKR